MAGPAPALPAGRGSLLAPHGVERAELATALLPRVGATRPGGRNSVVVANREFEAWFLAAAPSLQGSGG